MPVMTASDVLSQLQAHAESIKSGAPQTIGTMSVGDTARQGDLYLTRIAVLPASAKRIKRRQLAEGTTQGSRHEVPESVEVYEADAADVVKLLKAANPKVSNDVAKYIGPVVLFRTDAPVMHPEHGWLNMPADGVCAVTFQRSLDAEEREQRVQD